MVKNRSRTRSTHKSIINIRRKNIRASQQRMNMNIRRNTRKKEDHTQKKYQTTTQIETTQRANAHFHKKIQLLCFIYVYTYDFSFIMLLLLLFSSYQVKNWRKKNQSIHFLVKQLNYLSYSFIPFRFILFYRDSLSICLSEKTDKIWWPDFLDWWLVLVLLLCSFICDELLWIRYDWCVWIVTVYLHLKLAFNVNATS